jgi:hypothetical protein
LLVAPLSLRDRWRWPFNVNVATSPNISSIELCLLGEPPAPE